MTGQVIAESHACSNRLTARTVGGMAIEAALQTPDGAWRVEIVKRGQTLKGAISAPRL
jgi:hypothetical protein